MCLLKKLLNKATDSDRSLTNKLAIIAGCKVPALYKFIHEDNREFDNFEGLLKVVQFLFPEREQEIMIDYSNSLNVNKRTARNMLEYLTTNRLVKEFGALIERMKMADNKVSKEWAAFYEYFYNWQNNFKKDKQLQDLYEIRLLNASSKEMMVFQNILELFVYYHIKEYRVLKELLGGVLTSLNELDNDYIKTSYINRVSEMQGIISFRVNNDPESARHHAEIILNNNLSTRFNAFATYVLGMSYFFIDYGTSLKHLHKSASLYKQLGHELSVNEITDSIETLQAYWGIDTEYTTFKNKCFYDITRGHAIPQFDTLKEDDDSFYLLIKGVSEKNVNVLIESLISFVKKGDSFFGNIPKRELGKLGFEENFLNSLILMNA